MAIAAGAAVSNIYYCQPLLGIMTREFPGSWATAYIPTATQLGYALGIFLLVPLGDLLERRRLIVAQFVAVAVAMAAAGFAPSAPVLLIASLVVGAAASVAQHIIPFAAHMASPERRGAVIGTVMAGLLCGILLSRTVSGFVGQQAGFRVVFWGAAPLALVLGVLMRLRLPTSQPTLQVRYGELMRSLGALWSELPELRRAAFTQALLFAAFSAFWSTLAFRLEEPQYGMGASVAGTFGVIGAFGVLAAPIAGRVADKRGPRVVVRFCTLLSVVSWVILGAWWQLAGLVVGVVLLDFAVQSCLISNQTLIYSLRPEARSRINTCFMGTMFVGAAAGSALAASLYHTRGWLGVSALSIALTLAAAALQFVATPRPASR